MASKQTANYGLSQWEATDQVVRLDFNADNAKIDAGLAAAQDTADRALEQAETAYTPANSPFVVGSYIGDGAASQNIALGFKPSAVFISASNSMFLYSTYSFERYYAAFCMDGYNAAFSQNGINSWVENDTIASVTDDGFRAAYFSASDSINGRSVYLNCSGTRYFYIAFR